MSRFPTVNGVPVLMPAPEGYVVDLNNPARNGQVGVYWAYGVGNVLALLFLGQRLYTRAFLCKGLRMDDGLIILSWMFSQATQIMLLYSFITGIEGIHAWELTVSKYQEFLLISWIDPWIYIICGSLAKLSLLVVCIQLAPGGWFRTCSWATVGIVLGNSTVLIFLCIFSCTPVSQSWDVTVSSSDKHCINVIALYFATAIANIITDAITAILPVPLIMRLQMPMPQKIGAIFVFAFASLTVVTSMVRCSLLPSLLSNEDETWVIARPSLWAIIEANLVVICASMTTLRRFFAHVAPSLMGDTTSGGNTGGATAAGIVTVGEISDCPDRHVKFPSSDHEMHPVHGNSTKISAGPGYASDDDLLEPTFETSIAAGKETG